MSFCHAGNIYVLHTHDPKLFTHVVMFPAPYATNTTNGKPVFQWVSNSVISGVWYTCVCVSVCVCSSAQNYAVRITVVTLEGKTIISKNYSSHRRYLGWKREKATSDPIIAVNWEHLLRGVLCREGMRRPKQVADAEPQQKLQLRESNANKAKYPRHWCLNLERGN